MMSEAGIIVLSAIALGLTAVGISTVWFDWLGW